MITLVFLSLSINHHLFSFFGKEQVGHLCLHFTEGRKLFKDLNNIRVNDEHFLIFE